jgi:hypothetical protein
VATHLFIDAPLLLQALQVTEQKHSDEFFVCATRLEVAQALIFQVGLVIVEVAD